MKFILSFFVGFALIASFPISARAQEAVEKAAPQSSAPTPEKIQQIISGLSETERVALTRLLEVLATKNSPANVQVKAEPELIENIKSTWQSYTAYLENNLAGVPVTLAGFVQSMGAIFGGRTFADNLEFLGFFFSHLQSVRPPSSR